MAPKASSTSLRAVRSASGKLGSSRTPLRPSEGAKSFNDFQAASTDP
jgi:hypothetical protein